MITFEAVHPYRLSDGRRFTTLVCAGHSVFTGELYLNDEVVTHVPTGITYTAREAMDAYDDRSSVEWESIKNPMKGWLLSHVYSSGRATMARKVKA